MTPNYQPYSRYPKWSPGKTTVLSRKGKTEERGWEHLGAIPVGRHLQLSGTESENPTRDPRSYASFQISSQGRRGDPPQNHKCKTKLGVSFEPNTSSGGRTQNASSLPFQYFHNRRVSWSHTFICCLTRHCSLTVCHLSWCLPYVFIFACGCGSSFVVINKRCDS